SSQAGSARAFASHRGDKTLMESASHWHTKVLSYRQMKEPKTKSRGKTKARPTRRDPGADTPYSKPALRSEAFVRALTNAKACLKNPEDLHVLFNEAAKKAAA